MKRYEEVMEEIKVTDAMRSRILANLQEIPLEQMEDDSIRKGARKPQAERKVLRSTWKKGLAAAACLMIAACGIAFFTDGFTPEKPSGPNVMIPGPVITQTASAEELAEEVGFPVEELTELPFIPAEIVYCAWDQQLAEITYTGETEKQVLVFRKSRGEDDNSGDYNLYEEETTLHTDGGLTAEAKGNEGRIGLILWQQDGFSYSISCVEGMTEEDAARLVDETNLQN
ncbi:MAG: hypothetical protein ACI4WY_04180 [Anaerovoracaceae bacterium]